MTTVAPGDARSVPVAPADPGALSELPIGRPFPGVHAYVLDPSLRHVAEGAVGELYLAGHQLARGYEGLPARTAATFVADPHRPGRMYRTGDLVTWNSAEGLVYLGRGDLQVKVRGFRVELAGLAAAAAKVPGVSAAHVLVDGFGATASTVVFIASRYGLDPERVREVVRAGVPGQVAPDRVMLLERIPTTVNGKIDERGLRAELDAAAHAAPRASGTPALDRVLSLFTEVLGRTEIAPEENFFHAGGHSLSAMKLAVRLQAEFGTEVGVRMIFTWPTAAALAEQLGGTAASQPGGTDQKCSPAGQDATAAVPATAPADEFPLSPAQFRVWFQSQLTTAHPLYSLSQILELTGSVNAEALGAALVDVSARHPALRSIHFDGDTGPQQRVLEAPEAVLDVVDAAAGAPASGEPLDITGPVRPLIEEVAVRPFDLAVERPLRARLVVLGPHRSLLVLVTHHIACDGWSMGILSAELGEAYAARLAGTAPQWAPLPVSFAEVVLRGRRRFATGSGTAPLADGLAQWAAYLDGAPEVTPLPTDAARPRETSHRGDSLRFIIDASTWAAVRALATAQGATAFMALHAAVVAVLERFGAGEDIVVGTPVAGRDDPATTGVIGMFADTLALRVDLSGRPSFAELLRRVASADATAYDQRDVPFESIVERVAPSRTLAHHPVFQVFISLYNGNPQSLELAGLEVREHHPRSPWSRFDLSFHTQQTRDEVGREQVQVDLEYSSDLFTHRTVASIRDVFLTLLRNAPAAPLQPLDRLDVLGQRRADLLARGTGQLVPRRPTTVHQMVGQGALAHPDTAAVLVDDEVVSHAELAERAATVSRSLRTLGVRDGDVVAVAVPRSVAQVVALLGVLGAGAAYLPLDLDHPVGRLRMLCEDARVKFLVRTADADTSALFGGTPPPVAHAELVLDRHGSPGSAPTSAMDLPDVPPDAPAYVIYTSGSTGRPKGVVVSHAAAVNQLSWMQEKFALRVGERVLQKTPTGFDVSVTEIFWPLSVGATLVPLAPGGQGDPVVIAATLQRHDVSTAFFVPTMLGEYLASGAPLPAGLRQVVVTGEAVSPELVDAVGAAGGVTFHNCYGPTEVAVHATSWSSGDESTPSRVPIGTPLTNVRAYVLDGAGALMPDGAIGELYLAGVQLAHGYHDRPGVTAGRFVANPFAGPGSRMYRTGDFARWNASGSLEYFGRQDAQMKVRGVRVEIAEVEAALAALPDVSAAVVIVDAGPGGDRLIGYATLREGATVAAGELLTALTGVLPPAMVPAAVVVVDAISRLPNGKIDRAALPEAFTAARPVAGQGRLPTTATELAVARAFNRVLGCNDVRADDTFFARGGDSITSIRLVSDLRAHGLDAHLRDVFERPAVSDLAALLQGRVTVPADSPHDGATNSADDRTDEEAPVDPSSEDDWNLIDLSGAEVERLTRAASQRGVAPARIADAVDAP